MTNIQFRADRERKRLSGRIKKRILQRDDFRCRACSTRGDLTIHHAIPLADFFKKNKNTKHKIQEIRDDEILVTLCEVCQKSPQGGHRYFKKIQKVGTRTKRAK